MNAVKLSCTNPTYQVQEHLGFDNVQDAQATDQLLDNIFSLAIAKSLQSVHLQVEFVSDTHSVPSTGRTIREAFDNYRYKGVPMPIYTGSCDKLYWSVRTNLMYRILHDYDHAIHYNLGCGSTKLQDEKYLNGLMLWRVLNLPTSDDYKYVDILDCVHALYYDLIETQHYYHSNDKFVEDQRSFVSERMQKYYNQCTSVEAKLRSASRLLTICGIDFHKG